MTINSETWGKQQETSVRIADAQSMDGVGERGHEARQRREGAGRNVQPPLSEPECNVYRLDPEFRS